MSEHALKIIGVDQETNAPVRIALTLVLGEAPGGAKIERFAAPRGFMPASTADVRASVRAEVASKPTVFAAPRGFLPMFD